jgi:N-carbamoylputrescine amidase
VRIIVIQTKWADNARDNLDIAANMTIVACRAKRPDFLCLPEFFLGPGWYMPGQGHLLGITDDVIPGKVTDKFCDIAREYKTTIVAGSIVEKLNGEYYNTSTFINPDGELVAKIHKIHTFANESVNCKAGSSFEVLPSTHGLIGIAVCSDFWILETIRVLSIKGARIVFVPGGSLRQNLPSMVQAFKTTAYLNDVILVYAGAVGHFNADRGGETIRVEFAGTSLIASPRGILAEGSISDADYLCVDISNNELDALGKQRKDTNAWMSLHARQPDSYSSLQSDYVNKKVDISEDIKNRTNQMHEKASRKKTDQ